jgi:ATP-dependent Lhr-like helicase
LAVKAAEALAGADGAEAGLGMEPEAGGVLWEDAGLDGPDVVGFSGGDECGQQRGSDAPAVTDQAQRPTDLYVRLREDLTPDMWKAARAEAPLVLPDVDPRAVRGLKFSAALPAHLAVATVAARLADLDSAEKVLGEATCFTALQRS